MQLINLIGTAAGMVGALTQFPHTVAVHYVDAHNQEKSTIHSFAQPSSSQLTTFIKSTVPSGSQYSLTIGYGKNTSKPVENYQMSKCNALLIELSLIEDTQRINPIILVQAPRPELVEAALADYLTYTQRCAGKKDNSLRYFEGNGKLTHHTFKNAEQQNVIFKDVMIYKPHRLFDPQDWKARWLMKVNLR